MLFLALLQLSISSSVSRNYCNIYSCKPASMSFAENTCIYPSLLYSTYYLNPCPPTLPYCAPNLTSEKNVTCQASAPPTTYASYPGEPCNVTSDCVSGTCVSGVCYGMNVGQSCTSHSNCNPGLRCTNGLCASLLNVGTAGCLTDYDCVPNSGCLKNATSGTCTLYFTVANNNKIPVCNKNVQGGYSYLCQTGFCVLTNTKTNEGMCSQAPVSAEKNPKSCFYNSDCSGFTSEFNITGTCTCGINPTATSYCQPFMGDIQGVNFVSALKAFIDKDYAMQCNTVRRFSMQCWSLFEKTSLFNTLFKAYFLYQYYPQLQGNDVCVQNMLFANYYQTDSFASVLGFLTFWLIS